MASEWDYSDGARVSLTHCQLSQFVELRLPLDHSDRSYTVLAIAR